MAFRRILVLPICLLGTMTIPSVPAPAQQTGRVSVDSAGLEADSGSLTPSISGDGRCVAFYSAATNLVPFDWNSSGDTFVHDRRTGITTRVSVTSAGVEASTGSACRPSISSEGRHVAFGSDAANLGGGFYQDIFVHDRETGITEVVSTNASGMPGDNFSYTPSISADGRFVAFMSYAKNLVPGDGNISADIFVKDRQTGAIRRVSIDSAGNEGNNSSFDPSISADGQRVAFQSQATNLVPGDTTGFPDFDVFVHDLQTGITTRASVDSSGVEGNGSSAAAVISADGFHVAFQSSASNLVVGDINGMTDFFHHDLQTGTTTRVGVDAAIGVACASAPIPDPSISADGRLVSFESDSSTLVPGDTNNSTDVFVHDTLTGTTTRWSVDSSGNEGNQASYLSALSGDGRFVAFVSHADNLVPDDLNLSRDVFARGPSLTLEADPENAASGAPLSLTTWGGLPGGGALLYTVDVNGTPFLIRIATGAFDVDGEWVVAGTVPGGLSGNVVTFLGIGVAPAGKLELSNVEAVTFL